MPELPEVETVVRDLRPLLTGRTITAVRRSKRKLRRPWQPQWDAAVGGMRVEGLRRRGKWILIDLAEEPTPLAPPPAGRGESDIRGALTSSAREKPTPQPPPCREGEQGIDSPPTSAARGGSEAPLPRPRAAEIADAGEARHAGQTGRGVGGVGSCLRVHLGMSGQFTVVPATAPEPDHLHVVFALDDANELRLRDPRRFGSAEYFPDRHALETAMNADLGPEPFDIPPDYFRDAVRGTNRTLKAILLDQTIVAGVGNIYADEACFRAGLHPGRTGKSLSADDCDRLRAGIEAVITKAIESRGSTIRDYVGGSGLRGGFQAEFAVYGRTAEACPTCETAIAVARYSGRASHYCPVCQKDSPQRARRAREEGKRQRK